MKEKIWLSPPHMGGKELDYVNDVFLSNWIAPLGPHVDGFEKELALATGVKHVAALSSGTAAIHLALIILGIGAGDEVICQSFTFSGTTNPIIYQKAIPVFIDSEKDTWNMDPELLEEAIKGRIKCTGKKPKAIIVVDLYGMPARLDEIEKIANKYEIPLIEDAAEALGSKYNGKFCGSYGIFGILSFNGNKIITTSGGGALLSDNEDFIKKARFLATQSRDSAPHYQHSEVGYNYRMSNVLAGIGRGQLEVLKEFISLRRKTFEYYKQELSDIQGVAFLHESKEAVSNRWLTTITIDPEKTKGVSRETIRLTLEKENIESRPLWKPMHLQPVFEKYPSYLNGTSEKLFEMGLCLPSGSSLKKEQKERIVGVIKSCF